MFPLASLLIERFLLCRNEESEMRPMIFQASNKTTV